MRLLRPREDRQVGGIELGGTPEQPAVPNRRRVETWWTLRSGCG